MDGLTSTWPAPAKINLFLHILGQLPNGYHQLQTVFQLLDYSDELTFKLRSDGKIITHSPIQNNLITKAALLLKQASGTAMGAEISLQKKIPIGGGLGGGSSNAATTLVALNLLWNTHLEENALLTLGLQLGADVPVFIKGKSAWGEGIGEKLSPLELPPQWYVVVTPSIAVSTHEIFSLSELTRNTPAITIQQFLRNEMILKNDFEKVVITRYPLIAETLDWLKQFGKNAKLTGTGSSVFLAVADEMQAQKIVGETPKHLKAFAAKGINSSPLLKMSSIGTCC